MILLCIAISYLLGLNIFHLGFPVFIVLSSILILFLIIRLKNKTPFFIIPYILGILISVGKIYIPFPSNSFTGIVTSYGENYIIVSSFLKNYYVKDENNTYEFGDVVKVSGVINELHFQTYESKFNFQEYLFSKGVKYGIETKADIKVLIKNIIHTRSLKTVYLSRHEKNVSMLIDALVFSHLDYESEIISNANALNIIFMFSLSGVYFSLLLKGSKAALKFIVKKKIIADILAPILFLPLIILIFPKIGIVRVIYVYILRLINEYALKKKFSSLNIVSFAMLSLLFVNYTYAYQSGFIIGFALSLLIIFLQDYFKTFNKKLFPLLLRMAIFIFMLPISSYLNGSFHPFSIFYQLIFLPINLSFIILNLIGLYIAPLPFLNIYVFIYDKVLSFLGKIDISLSMGDLGVIFIILFYVFLVYLIYLLENKRKRGAILISSGLLTMFFISFIPIKNVFTNAIYFINVGQGDSTLIQNKNHAVLIDTGGNFSFDMASDVLIPFFKKKQIYKLDALITTHNDFDHNGAADSLLHNFKVDKYLTRRNEFPYQVGDIYLENLNNMAATEDNEFSLVFNLSFLNKKFLLMGDASINVEKYLIENNLDIDCDILKVGHHGSKTSSSEEFIKKVSPKEAIISCGYKNKYHHPNDEVVDILKKYNVKIHRTDYEGTISYQRLSFFS